MNHEKIALWCMEHQGMFAMVIVGTILPRIFLVDGWEKALLDLMAVTAMLGIALGHGFALGGAYASQKAIDLLKVGEEKWQARRESLSLSLAEIEEIKARVNGEGRR